MAFFNVGVLFWVKQIYIIDHMRLKKVACVNEIFENMLLLAFHIPWLQRWEGMADTGFLFLV